MDLIYKKSFIKHIWLLTFILFFAAANGASAIGTDFIIKYIVPDKAGKLLFLGGKKQDKGKIKYNITRLTEPNRMVVDIENAIFEKGTTSLTINNKDLTEDIRISQFSKEPDVVRIVFTSESVETLDNIKVIVYKNNLSFEFGEVELAKIPVASVYQDRKIKGEKPAETSENPAQEEPVKEEPAGHEVEVTNGEAILTVKETKLDTKQEKKEAVLEEIKNKFEHNITIKSVGVSKNRILLSGAGIISVSEPFKLEEPKRMIFDLPEGVLDSTELIKTFTLENTDEVQISQFDAKTVRIVITGEEPGKYTTALSPDLQSVVISPKDEIFFAEFPDNNSIGAIKEIKVVKEDEATTKVIFVSEKPIIHNIDRIYKPDRFDLTLYNIKKPERELLDGMETTGQFHGCEIASIEKFPNSSKWLFPLNKTSVIKSKLSLDGRVLEITLQDALVAEEKKIKKKIVIDPGHGGYDPGAEKNGIYEKDINLDVAKRVKKYLYEAGYYVIMTRETDKTLSLKERVEIANKANPDLFLSIHVNASRSPNIKGLETHWYTQKSRPLAIHVQDQFVSKLVTPDRGLKNSRFYVIRNTNIPAVLTEIGYMTNETEMYQLMTEERREATARAIADGIINYIKSQTTPSTQDGRQKL